jgi:hypothetical protein
VRYLVTLLVVAAYAQDTRTVALAQPQAVKSTEEILEKLRKNPGDLGSINDLARRSEDPRVIPALRESFLQAKLSARIDEGFFPIPVAREIASVLIKLGVKDDV